MIIVTAFYNAENYIERCIGSLLGQKYKQFKCYLIDDVSTDTSVEKIKKMIEHDNRFILIQNDEKKYKPGNIDMVLRFNEFLDDNEVIVELDGDDWLPDCNTLMRINEVYQDDNVWITNGSFKYSTGHLGFSSEQIDFENLRISQFTASHMRTWRLFLWNRINQNDLKDDNGNWWKVNGDLAYMLPMLEMAGKKHYKFLKEINYIYNGENPINDHKVDMALVIKLAEQIRKRPKYKKIDE